MAKGDVKTFVPVLRSNQCDDSVGVNTQTSAVNYKQVRLCMKA